MTNRRYDILEYKLEKENTSLFPILRLPLVVIILIVISWNFSMLPIRCGLYVIIVTILITYLYAWNTVVAEHLLVISSLGIQVEQINVFGKLKYVKFVPMENIKAVVINEIIRRHRVIPYLLVILNSKDSTGKTMVPLLVGTLPRLRVIESIYNEIQNVIC